MCNAYTELNQPLVQRSRFAEQAKQSAEGDDEAQVRGYEKYDISLYECTQMISIIVCIGGMNKEERLE